jgi:hypothetical protein
MMADHPISVVPTLQRLADFSLRLKDTSHYVRQAATLPKPPPNPSVNDVRLLIYSGSFDLNCNMLGTLHTLEVNLWRNRPWTHAERSLWKFGNDVAGRSNIT